MRRRATHPWGRFNFFGGLGGFFIKGGLNAVTVTVTRDVTRDAICLRLELVAPALLTFRRRRIFPYVEGARDL